MSSDDKSSLPFVEILTGLKQRGSNLLIVGSVPEEVHHSICKKMLANNSNPSRYRIIILPDADSKPVKSHPSNLRYPVSESPCDIRRNIENPYVCKNIDGEWEQTLCINFTNKQLDELENTITETIDQLEAANDDFLPAELRVCFSMYLRLFDVHESEAVISTMRSLTRRIRRSNGMAHFHLSTTSEQQFKSRLAPLFDAIVELDVKEGTPYQRWQLEYSDINSEWLPIA